MQTSLRCCTDRAPRAGPLARFASLLFACLAGSGAAFADNPISVPAPVPVNAAGCTRYGAPPRPLAPYSLDGLFDKIASGLINVCRVKGEILAWRDADGTPRRACLFQPAHATPAAPLPMIVWLHPTLLGQDAIMTTGLLDAFASADLSGDPGRPGFILLMPLGRTIRQFLPFPLNTGVGWDHWYRNLDRGSPNLNVDVAAIDHFIDAVKARGLVDSRRVYVSGWSAGADMGALYGLNTPGIAATAVFSTISPFDDPADPCPAPPVAVNHTRPFYLMARACDIGGACQGARAFVEQLRSGVMAPGLVDGVILNGLTRPVEACNAGCATGKLGSVTAGHLEHAIWPRQWNARLFDYLREHAQ